MPTPASRTPVRVARGTYSNLNSSVSDIQEGEIVYATDQDRLYVKEGSALVNTQAAINASTALTNAVQTFSAAQRGAITTVSPGATITLNMDQSNNYALTLNQNGTIANPTNQTPGQSGSIFLVQDGTGSRTAAWGSYWDFAGGVAPVLTTAANAVDRVDYVVRSASSIHAVATLNLS